MNTLTSSTLCLKALSQQLSMTLTPIKSKKCSYKRLSELLYQLDCSMDDELIAGIDTLRNVLKHNSYAELSSLYQQHSAYFNINELLYFAWAGCEDALLDINQNLNSQDGEILFITAISLAHLNQDEGFTLLNALCANKAHVIMNEDDIYLSLSEHIQFVQYPKAREIEEKYLKHHPNNIFLE